MYRIRSIDRTPLKITQATLRSRFAAFRSGHLTRDIRLSPRLGLRDIIQPAKHRIHADVICNRTTTGFNQQFYKFPFII